MKKLNFFVLSLIMASQLNAWQVTVQNRTNRVLSVGRVNFFPGKTSYQVSTVAVNGKITFENINTYGVEVQGSSAQTNNLTGSSIAIWGECEKSSGQTNRIIYSLFYLRDQTLQNVAGPDTLQPTDIYIPRAPGGEITVINAGECSIKVSQGIPPVPGQITINAPPQMI